MGSQHDLLSYVKLQCVKPSLGSEKLVDGHYLVMITCACVRTDWSDITVRYRILYTVLLFSKPSIPCRKCHVHCFAVSLPQIVLGTILSVQMDLVGQHTVQVVGHIPSGSVELCHSLFFLFIQLSCFFNYIIEVWEVSVVVFTLLKTSSNMDLEWSWWA